MAWYNPITWFGSSGNSTRTGAQNPGPNRYSSESAAPVTFDTAMSVSAFWAATRVLSESVAAMPLKCYRRMPDGSRKEDRDYPIWRILNYMPNRYQTRTEFFETLMLNLVTNGNSYSELVRTPRGISSYLPLMASQMEVTLNRDGSLTYEYTEPTGEKRTIPAKNIWHIKLFGNSILGMSPLAYARQSLGISIAAEARVGKLAKNGGKSSGILTIDRVLNDQQRKAVRKNMDDISTGDSDSLKILEADMKYQQVSLSPQDMELLSSRRFQLEDVARFVGVPSVLINDTAGSTVWGSGIGEIMRGFYKVNLRPYNERIEASMKRHLIPIEDWEIIDIEFDFDSLLRADRDTRLKSNAAAINSGQMTPNEARNDEGREDKEGGDKIYLNGSLRAADEPFEKPSTEQRVTNIEEGQQNEND